MSFVIWITYPPGYYILAVTAVLAATEWRCGTIVCISSTVVLI
jgi:hypothetical protein